MAAYEVLLLNTAIPQIQAAQSGDTYVVPRDIQITANLDVTGNTILGDASTDTVRVNGYMGVGGAGASTVGVNVVSAALSGATQYGIAATPVGTGTTQINGIAAAAGTSNTAFTVANASGFRAIDLAKGAASTITNYHGVYVEDLTQGTNNYGITSVVSSGTNKWNIYASGTANNYFAGNVGIGTSSPAFPLDVQSTGIGSIIASRIYRSDGTIALLRIGNSSSGSASSAPAFGSDTTAAVVYTSNAEKMRIDSSGNVKIGGSADRATTVGTNHLDIFNGTAPVGTLTNGISIYSSAGEAYVMDAAGNATLFSPHDAETNFNRPGSQFTAALLVLVPTGLS